MNRGSDEAARHGAPKPAASMRPRFMNRGSSSMAVSLVHKRLASMRPRFMNRGSTLTVLLGSRREQCFNEAPIHESGK